MVKIKFIYINNKYILETEDNKDNNYLIFYSSLINQDLNQLVFLYKGKILDAKNIKNKLDYANSRNIIFVFKKKQMRSEKKEKIKDIICPECQRLSLLNINDDKSFTINNCHCGHNFNLNLDSFLYLQKIDESKINCYKCGNNKSYYNNLIYINSKGKYICPLCLDSNDTDIINYKFKFFYCNKHNQK